MNGIAIAGKAAAGKNAFADVLFAELIRRGQWPVMVNFADGVKAELWETQGKRKEDEGGRDALVEIGHGRRQADPDYWVKRLEERVVSLRPFGVLPIVTDLRYSNEKRWAEAHLFVTVRIEAMLLDRAIALLNRGEDPAFAESDHPSECELDEAEFDVRFLNSHDSYNTLARYSSLVADMLLGDVEELVA